MEGRAQLRSREAQDYLRADSWCEVRLTVTTTIETGAVHINGMSVHDEPALPHGGAKKSGWGRFNGEEGLKEWVRWSVIPPQLSL